MLDCAAQDTMPRTRISSLWFCWGRHLPKPNERADIQLPRCAKLRKARPSQEPSPPTLLSRGLQLLTEREGLAKAAILQTSSSSGKAAMEWAPGVRASTDQLKLSQIQGAGSAPAGLELRLGGRKPLERWGLYRCQVAVHDSRVG